ncbi:MAG: glycosyltransferase family 4 protein [Acidobacteriota bacterium]
MTSLRIALVVQGRFHAFDLARELSRRGHDVTIFTNYPAWAVRRFDVGCSRVRSCWAHGAAVRGLDRLPRALKPHDAGPWVHRTFGRWAARALQGTSWDVVHCWSGVSEELLTSPATRAGCTLLMRGSAHIAVQDAILQAEETRAGCPLERPSPWMISRERREYELADRVVVPSSFARDTFAQSGVAPARVVCLPLGVDVRAFQPMAADVAARAARIRGGDRLRVLYVGALSMRKGLLDLEAALARVVDVPLDVRLVGTLTPEAAGALGRMDGRVAHRDAIAQRALPAEYRAADVFVFPTLEDGFGLVLTQAKAAGLPVLCTTNCAGADLIREGEDGWIVPVRSADAIADRLRWCHAERDALATITERAAGEFRPRDWSTVAGEFEVITRECLATPARRAFSA